MKPLKIRKKIIIVSPVVSLPTFSGNCARISQIIRALEEFGAEIYFVLAPTKCMHDQRHGTEMENKFGERLYILNSGERTRGTLLNRIWSRLKKQFYLDKIPFFYDLILPWQLYSSEVVNEFKEIVIKVNPDFILGEYVITAPLISSVEKAIPTAVDTHDCFTNRNKKIRETGGSGLWWSLTRNQEKALLSQFDTVIAIQENEKIFFHALLSEDKKTKVKKVDILDLPVKVSCDVMKSQRIGFIGSNNHHNREGLERFITHHWPKIKQHIPNVELLIAGDVQVKSDDLSIVKLGRIEDLFDQFYSKCSVIINPCVTGSGLKIKTVEAMSHGIPVVATQEGISGIESAIGNGCILEDLDSEGFTYSCVKLLSSEEFIVEQASLARKYIENAYTQSLSVIQSLLTD